ncbi:MAG: sulfotransferase [Geminicoccaceae bacterium]
MSKLSMKRKHRERRRKAEAGIPSPASDPAERFERESRALLDLFNKRRFEEAIAEADRFIRRWPGHAFGYKLAGSACCELARFAEARSWLNRAIERNPADGETFGNLGVALFQLEDFDGAKEALLEALKTRADDASLHARLGYVYFRQKRYEIARHVLERSLALDPDRADTHKIMGDTLKPLKEPELAIAHLERALELRPGNWQAMMNLAVLYDDTDRTDLALTLYDEVFRIHPNARGLLANRGNSLLKKGRFNEALESFDRTLETDPLNAEAFRQLAIAGRIRPDDSITAAMAERFADDRVDIAERVLIGFGLGNIYGRAGEHERAFAAYDRANRLHRTTVSYDPGNDAASMERIAAICTRDYFAGTAHEGLEDASPVFVIGMPRSGSTLVEQIISAHPDVAGAGEVLFMQKLVTALSRESLRPFPDTLTMFKEDTASILARRYLAMLHERVGTDSRWITDKLLYNFLYIGLIQRMFPRASIVHVRRNPLDACLSMYFLKFAVGQDYSYDLAELGGYYRLYEKLMAHWQQVLPGRILDVNYEDVVADIEGETRRMLDHCGIPFDPACLEFHKSRRDVSTASNAQVREKLYTRAISRSDPYRPWLGPLIGALEAPPPAPGRPAIAETSENGRDGERGITAGAGSS